MMKSIQYLVFILLFLTIGRAAYSAETLVRVGVYGNRPLVFCHKPGGAPKGLFIDVLEEVARVEDWKIVYVQGCWNDLLQMLNNSEIDLLPAIAYSKERASRFAFTYETVITNWAELYTSSSLNITSLLELNRRKIGVKQGDIHYAALKDLTSKLGLYCRFIEADGYTTVMEMLHAGYVKVGVVSRLFGTQSRKQFEVRGTPVLFNPVEVRFAGPKGDGKGIVAALDHHLSKMKASDNSVYHDAVSRWLLLDSGSGFPVYIIYLLGVAGGLAFIFIMATFLMRLKVRERTEELVTANNLLTKEIHDRVEVEEQMSKLAEIVSASGDSMALLDCRGKHITVNNAYAKFASDVLGQEDVIGKSLNEVFGDEFYKKEIEEQYFQCLNGEFRQSKSFITRKKGDMLCLDIKFSPSVSGSDKGKVSGVVLDIRDVSDLWQLEESLKNAQKMEAVGLLAGSVAHDLNNILSGIVGYPDMLLGEISPEDKMYRSLMLIKKSGEKAAAVVSDLLTLSRRSVNNRVPLHFNSIVTDFLDSPEHRKMIADHSGLKYKTILTSEECKILGNSIQLSKVIMNLFVNALEAMPKGGDLIIETRQLVVDGKRTQTGEMPAGEYVCLSLADSGVGIPRENISRIFEPFYTSKVMGKSGTGLGMSIVYGIVKDHKGYIDLESSPDEGTTFNVYFPVTGQDVYKENRSEDLGAWKGDGEHVLLIDDLADQRLIASEMLTRLGYSVQVAGSGEEGVAYLRQESDVDLVILDMIMPGGMDGLHTYREIVKINSSLPTIIASGFSHADHIYKARRMGAGMYLKKPYTMLELAKAVRAALG